MRFSVLLVALTASALCEARVPPIYSFYTMANPALSLRACGGVSVYASPPIWSDTDYLWRLEPAANGSTSPDLVSLRVFDDQRYFLCATDETSLEVKISNITDLSLCTFRKVPGLSDVGMVSFINGGRYLSFGSTAGGSCGKWIPGAFDAQLKVEPSTPESATWAPVPTTFVGLKVGHYYSPAMFLHTCNGEPSATLSSAPNSYDNIWVFEQGLNTSNPDTVSIRSTRNVDQYFCFDGKQASMRTAAGNEGPCSFVLGNDPMRAPNPWMGGFGFYTQDGKILQKAGNVTINDCTKTDSYPIATRPSLPAPLSHTLSAASSTASASKR
eukprot:m51a1_g13242 hypothetical protein (327) ;mRNA; r:18-1342